MHNYIINKYPEYKRTCAINDLKDGCITFIRNKEYLRLTNTNDTIILVPKSMTELPFGWHYEFIDNVDYTFTMIHNILWKDISPQEHIIGKNCFIHLTTILDIEGIHYAKAPDGSRIQMKHIGNVEIGDNVSVFALTTIQRGIFGSTVLCDGVKIDSHVNIGHNSYIGKNSVIALGAILGGSVTLGENCMIGLGAIIRNGINICSNVIIGQGSNVVSNITNPGIYIGNPAKFFKPYDSGWNF